LFEWLIEKIIVALGCVALSAAIVSIYTYFVLPIVTWLGALAIVEVTHIKRRWKILIFAIPTLYFGGGLIMSFLLMIWMGLPDI